MGSKRKTRNYYHQLIRRFFYIERLAFDFKEKFSLFIEFYTKILLFFQNHIFCRFSNGIVYVGGAVIGEYFLIL